MASWRVDRESGGKLKDVNWGHGLDSKLGETTKSYHPSGFTLLIRSLRSHYRRSVKTQKIRSKMFICNTLSYSPRQLLQTLLQRSLDITKNSTLGKLWEQYQKVSRQNRGLIKPDRLFSVKRTRDGYPVRYISPIAHRLATNSPQPATEIAQELVTQLLVCRSPQLENNFSPSPRVEVLQALTIQATTAGYIQFDFSDRAIAEYLNLLLHSLPGPPQPPACPPRLSAAIPQLQRRIFRLQHTHARCCSLLRLAHHHRFIQLNPEAPADQIGHWQITSPTPLSWLTATLQFHTDHAAELQLIAQIVAVLDTLADWGCDALPGSARPASTEAASTRTGVMTLLSAAEELSQAFQASDQCWQLMGNLRTQGRDRLQAHLGLILITQRLLYQLLQVHLGIETLFAL